MFRVIEKKGLQIKTFFQVSWWKHPVGGLQESEEVSVPGLKGDLLVLSLELGKARASFTFQKRFCLMVKGSNRERQPVAIQGTT